MRAGPAKCQFALSPPFYKLVGDAEDAGWSKAEVAVALRELAEAHIIELATQNAGLERDIAALLKGR